MAERRYIDRDSLSIARSEPPRPRAILLDNGDVMVPAADGTMERVAVGAPDHAAWVARLQRESKGTASGTFWGIIVALLLPIVGVIVGIVMLARGRVGPGLAVLVATFVGFIVGLALLYG
jgi:hypothetical protein